MRLKAVAAAAALMAGSAIAMAVDKCCFGLTAYGGPGGVVRQLADGQNRIGDDSLPGSQYCLGSNGGTLTHDGGDTTWYSCPTGERHGQNLYAAPLEGEPRCVPVWLKADSCFSGCTLTSTTTADCPTYSSKCTSSTSSSKWMKPSTSSKCSTSTTSSKCTTSTSSSKWMKSTTSSKCTTSTTSSKYTKPVTSSKCSTSTSSKYTKPVTSSKCTTSSTSSKCSTSSKYTKPATSSKCTSSSKYTKPTTSSKCTSSSTSSKCTSSSTSSKCTSSSMMPHYSPPRSWSTSSKCTTSSIPLSPSPAQTTCTSSMKKMPSPTLKESCPAMLSGNNWEFPHLIVPISKSHPNKAYGTVFNGTVSPDVSSVFQFDIPKSAAGKTCNLQFYLPKQHQLETSAFELKGDATFNLVTANHAANKDTTTYKNAPKPAYDFGDFKFQPGHAYEIGSHLCPSGNAATFIMSAVGESYLSYFQDYNPCPIGLYITVS